MNLNEITRTLDIGCGLKPKNPFKADEVYGVDIRTDGKRVLVADLVVEPIPFEDNFSTIALHLISWSMCHASSTLHNEDSVLSN